MIVNSDVSITVGTEIEPKVYSIPETARFPLFFIDFPLLKSGVRHMISNDTFEARYSTNKDQNIQSIVKNPLNPATLKLLILLMAQKEQQIFMKVRDVMGIVSKQESNASRDFDRYIQIIQDAKINLTFLDESLIPPDLGKFLSTTKARRGIYAKRLRNVIIISSVADLVRIERKSRDVKINFSPEFIAIYNSFIEKYGYVKVKSCILKELTNKYSEEILIYLLALKPQIQHSKDYLVSYLLGCSQKFLIEKVSEEKIKQVDKAVRKIYSRSIESLEKLKELGVIREYSYTEGRLRLGDGGRTVPFFETLKIVKNPQ